MRKSQQAVNKWIIIIGLIIVFSAFWYSETHNGGRYPYYWLARPYSFLFDHLKCSEHNYHPDLITIKDDSMLEGQIVKIHDEVSGRHRACLNLRTGKHEILIVDSGKPEIIKVGTNRFKDTQLLAMTDRAGIRQLLEKEPVSIYYVDNYTDFIWAQGQYSHLNRAITVKRNSPNQKTILAHEYLHYVWHRDGLQNDKRLVNELQAFYDRSSDLKQRMKNYTHEMTVATEFFSYGCTEWSDHRLSSYILEKCNQYIDRSKLPMYY